MARGDTEPNPYAAPLSDDLSVAPLGPDGGGLWRHENLLVMRRDAVLPDRCVKSNEPGTRRLKRKLQWHHWSVYLAILANVIVYVVLALMFSRRATIEIGLTDAWFARRRWAIVIGWTTALAGVALIVGGLFWNDRRFVVLPIAGVVAILAGALVGLLGARLVVAHRIDRDHIWLKGACPAFLAELPPWSGPA